jgi:hypothetical protein
VCPRCRVAVPCHRAIMPALNDVKAVEVLALLVGSASAAKGCSIELAPSERLSASPPKFRTVSTALQTERTKVQSKLEPEQTEKIRLCATCRWARSAATWSAAGRWPPRRPSRAPGPAAWQRFQPAVRANCWPENRARKARVARNNCQFCWPDPTQSELFGSGSACRCDQCSRALELLVPQVFVARTRLRRRWRQALPPPPIA